MRLARIAVITGAVVCIILDGLWLWARDAVTPDPLPRDFQIDDFVWLISAASIFLVARWPTISAVFAWLLVITSALTWQQNHTWTWLAARTALPLASAALCHATAYLNGRIALVATMKPRYDGHR